MGLYENIKKACNERGISINKLEIELGLPRSSISKYNKNSPSIDRVQKIADFLEFPLEYITTGEMQNFSDSDGVSVMTYETIKKLCKEKGITVTGLEKELGISRGSLCKINTNKPSMEKVKKLADYFNVSVGHLMGGEEKEDSPIYYTNEETAKLAQEMFEDEDMRSLFDMKRNMPPERFKAHMEFMKNLYNQEKGRD